MEDCCVICAEPLEWLAYGPCDHKDVCSSCIARLRFVLKDNKCCICKQDCAAVFVTKVSPVVCSLHTLIQDQRYFEIRDYFC
jgi:hypothetical protein